MYSVHQEWKAIDKEWCSGSVRKPRLIGPNHNHKVAGPVWFLIESLYDNTHNVVSQQRRDRQGNLGVVSFIRTIEVRGIVVPAGGFRGATPQPQGGPVPHGPQGDVHKGHILAIFNGGPDEEENITPQWGDWQANRQREWRVMEHTVHNGAMNLFDAQNGYFAAHSPCVYYHAKVQYWENSWDEQNNWATTRFYHNQQIELPAHDHWIFSSRFLINAYPTTGSMSRQSQAPPAVAQFNQAPDNWPFNETFEGGPQGL